MSDLDWVSLKCESCGYESKKTVAWFHAHDEFTCRCGTPYLDLAEVRRSIPDLESSVNSGLDTWFNRIKKGK